MEDNKHQFILWLGKFGAYIHDEYGIDLMQHPEAFTEETSIWLVQAYRLGTDPEELVESMIEDVKAKFWRGQEG